MLRHARWDSWLPDSLYIWTNDETLPHLQQRIEEHWEPGEIEVISPDADEEMRFTHLDDEHDRVLFVWWDYHSLLRPWTETLIVGYYLHIIPRNCMI